MNYHNIDFLWPLWWLGLWVLVLLIGGLLTRGDEDLGRRFGIVAAVMTSTAYFLFRMTTLDGATLWDGVASVLLWIAELLGLFQLVIFYLQSWHLLDRGFRIRSPRPYSGLR
ncbi:hypothetical protein [Sulfobacillus sp. hq2]|uniref:hypothetical protein n=1 Tax=Sulfobacillus TaxID=28033 RepID=UPI001304B6BA|nr:hypothetical protein [Sulfobacillus sp. hq2]